MRLSGSVRRGCAALMALFALASPARAAGSATDGDRTFAVMPYLWLPNVNGTLNYDIPPGGGGGPEVDLANAIVENLRFAMMVSGEARKGKWALVTDLVYLDVDSQNSRVKSAEFDLGPGGRFPVAVSGDVGTRSGLEGGVWALGGSRTVAGGKSSSLDLFAGFRYLTLKVSTEWSLAADVTATGPGGTTLTFNRTGSVAQRVNLVDGVVGVRGSLGLGRGRWGMPFHLDAGAGSSALTWQAMGGIEYRFGWGDVRFVYRCLSYDEGSDELLQRVVFAGPALGVNFRF